MKLDKVSDIIYAGIESVIQKIDGCANNPENSSRTKIGEHIVCLYSMPTIWAFDHMVNKHTLYHEKDCMKKFCESFREHVKNINDFENFDLTKQELKSRQDAKVCHIYKSKNYQKIRDHCHHTGKCRATTHSL